MTAISVRIQLVVAVVGLALQFASVARADFLFGEPSPLPPPINSTAWETTGVFSPNGLELYFTSSHSGWGTSVSHRETASGPFGPPTRILNTLHPSLSGDGLSIYGNHDPGPYGGADISIASRPGLGGHWGAPSDLGSSVNSDQWERWASISTDGRELYFTRTTAYETAVADIWVARRTDPSATFEPAVRLPANINQNYTSAPSLSPDGLALFFASDRPGGYGDADIYVSYREGKDSPWGDPINLGTQVNSAGFEWQPSMSPDGQTFLFTRGPNRFQPTDIWQVAVIPEPSTFLLALLALGVVGGWRKWRG